MRLSDLPESCYQLGREYKALINGGGRTLSLALCSACMSVRITRPWYERS